MPEITPEQYEALKAQGFPPQVTQQQLLDTWKRAKSVEQAQKDVDAQLRMLGILRVKSAIEKGIDPAAATYSNLHLLSPAGSKGSDAMTRAVRPVPPVPAPYVTNFPGAPPGSPPTIITPSPRGAPGVHFFPKSDQSSTFTPRVLEPEPGVKVIQLGPNHWQYLGKNVATGDLPPTIQRLIFNDQLKELEADRANASSKDKEQIDQQIKDIRAQRNAIGVKTSPPTFRASMGDLKAATESPASVNVSQGSTTVTNKTQFDALPSGTVYIGKDGRKYRKP